MSLFAHLDAYAGDPILSLNEDFQRDTRPNKINLSIGIYFEDDGRIPVLDCVRQAEAQMLAEGGAKSYLPSRARLQCARPCSTCCSEPSMKR